MKFALFDKSTGAVRQWQDHGKHGYAKAADDELLQLPDDFEFPEVPAWVVKGRVTTTQPASLIPTIDSVKLFMWQRIRSERDRRIDCSGFQCRKRQGEWPRCANTRTTRLRRELARHRPKTLPPVQAGDYRRCRMTERKSPLAWLGGKSQLADRIVDRMPTHTTYCEVFAGAAWVLFKKPESKIEIINDINRELVTLYRCVKHHLPELVQQFRWMLVARDEFDRFMKTPADTLTDIQRAARFFFLAKTSFGAKVKGRRSASPPPRRRG
jgi:hypothetical protein